MNYLFFYIIILLTNIIQGITGFAGTILAMPPSLMLVGYNVAKPILNVLGLLAGLYVFITFRKNVNWREFLRVIIVMGIGMLIGMVSKPFFMHNEKLLYKLLGIFVIFLSLSGYYKILRPPINEKKISLIKSYVLLITSGVIHSVFVSGGPLLIGYLSKVIKDKVNFRATISTVWIVLNSIVLFDDIRHNLWTINLVKIQIISIPFLFLGMFIGTLLYKKMSQNLFMKITYILLFISGLSLITK